MKKVFALKLPGRADARVVEAVKNDVRKYVRRERRKPLPEGFDRWTFNCKAGPDAATARACELDELTQAIDAVSSAGSGQVFVEVVAVPGHRLPPASGVAPGAQSDRRPA